MRQATSGDKVSVQYIGTLADGREFDSSVGRDPFEITIGEGRLLNAVEEALVGMAINDVRTVWIESDNAYGARYPQLVQEINCSQLPEGIPIEIGTLISTKDPNGQEMKLVVTKLTNEIATLDGNHPLAGQDLTFELTLLDFCED